MRILVASVSELAATGSAAVFVSEILHFHLIRKILLKFNFKIWWEILKQQFLVFFLMVLHLQNIFFIKILNTIVSAKIFFHGRLTLRQNRIHLYLYLFFFPFYFHECKRVWTGYDWVVFRSIFQQIRTSTKTKKPNTQKCFRHKWMDALSYKLMLVHKIEKQINILKKK